LLTRFVLAALPAFAALMLLTRLCLTALLAALATLLLLAGLALAALLRIVLTLLVALRILRLVSHLDALRCCSKKPHPTEGQSAIPIGVPGPLQLFSATIWKNT
jgi:hypothetical protein